MRCCSRFFPGRSQSRGPLRPAVRPAVVSSAKKKRKRRHEPFPLAAGVAMKPLQIDMRPVAAALYDAVAIALAFFGAALLLDGNGLVEGEITAIFAVLTVAVPLQLGVNVLFGLYQGVWRYTSLPDIQRIVISVTAGTVVVEGTLYLLTLSGQLGYREYLLYP